MARKIVIVCGAGASSTFLAHRLRAAAKERGVDASFRAETLTGLADALAGTDVVLVGPHLGSQFDELRLRAEGVGAAAALLPSDVFGAPGAGAALDAVVALLAAPAARGTPPGPIALQPPAP